MNTLRMSMILFLALIPVSYGGKENTREPIVNINIKKEAIKYGSVVSYDFPFGFSNKPMKKTYQMMPDKLNINNINIERIKFSPEDAVEVPFDELFKSFEIIDLQRTNESKIKWFSTVVRTDSSLIVGSNNLYYLVFDHKGNFITTTGSIGEGIKSNISLRFFYAFNESILSICGMKWIKYDMKGTVQSMGHIPYKIYPYSFIPINEKTWLFYIPLIQRNSDTLRLWTTDQNFKVKKKYLSYNRSSPSGGSGFNKNIYQTTNGIYITDRVNDTIYRFTEAKVDPVYVFDFGSYKYRKQFEAKALDYNEADGLFTLVTSNSVIREVKMNKQNYFIYYNRTTKKTKTISKIIAGPNLLKNGELIGTDKDDRLYWTINLKNISSAVDTSLRFGYAKLLKLKKDLGNDANQILYITTIK